MIPTPHWMQSPHQGLLDIQLSFPETPPDREPPLLNAIAKRDRRVEPFETHKIEHSIRQAAHSIGVDDDALFQSLASSVTLYLMQQTRMKGLSVRHVAEAIQRVLVEMNYERIALAYRQHREHRQQEQHRWKGNQGARHQSERSASLSPDMYIAQECTRCSVPHSHHAALHKTVLHHLDTLAIEHPAAALIIELTREAIRADAGLDIEPAACHLELSIDTIEDTVTGAHSFPESIINPATSDRALAAYAKEAYALHRVFSDSTARAHQRGALHIHALDQVDRLHSISLYPDIVKRVGSLQHLHDTVHNPARKIEALIDDIVSSTHFLQEHCSHAVQWQGLNYTLAPYLVEFDDAALRQVSTTLLQAMATRPTASPVQTSLGIAWNVPHDLQGIEAIGPNGAYTGKSYDCYSKTAHDIARVLLQVFEESIDLYPSDVTPLLVVTLPSQITQDTATPQFYRAVAQAVTTLDEVEVRSEVTPLMLPFCEETLRAKTIVAQCVTLNLPRVAYALADGGHFWSELDQLFERATTAVIEKHTLLNTLVAAKQNGPYGLFAFQHHGSCIADLDHVLYGLDCCGMYECVQVLQDSMTERNEMTPDNWIAAILEHLEMRCAEWSTQNGIRLALYPAHDLRVSQRFARLDLEHTHDSATQVLHESSTPQYSSWPTQTVGIEEVLQSLGSCAHHFQGSSVPISSPHADAVFPEQIQNALSTFFQHHDDIGLRFSTLPPAH